MKKLIVLTYLVLLYTGCNDNSDLKRKEFVIKEGTIFCIKERQTSSELISICCYEVAKDTMIYGYEYNDSDLLYKIPFIKEIGGYIIGDFYIQLKNDTIYTCEPLYSIYTNTKIVKHNNATNITFDTISMIYNAPLKIENLFPDTSITIQGEINVK